MAGGPIITKKFDEFKPVRRKWKMMNKLYIKGELKRSFWFRKTEFELCVVFTHTKKQIIDIQLVEAKDDRGDEVTLRDPRFEIDFKIGEHIDEARRWVKEKGHTIDFEVNKFEEL